MSDWYDIALDEYLFDVAINAGIPKDAVDKIYSLFYNDGTIDYDVMKEFLQTNYVEDETLAEDDSVWEQYNNE